MAEHPEGSFTEIGVTGLRHSFGRINDELLVHLKGKRGLRTFREMNDNDPTVGSIMFLFKTLMRKVPWISTPNPENPEDPKAIDWAKFAQSLTVDMSQTWPDLITDILSMTWAGYSIHELVLKERGGRVSDLTKRSRFDDGLIGIRKLPIRAQETIDQWVFDDHGDVTGFWQLNNQASNKKAARLFIPMAKAVLFRTESNKNNPEGRSLLRNAYRPWYFKKRIEEIEAIGIERDLAGLPVMQVPRRILSKNATPADIELRDEMIRVLSLLRRDALGYAMVPAEVESDGQGGQRPSGFKLGLLTTGGRRQIDTSGIVTRYDQRIAMTLIADLVMMGMSKVGTFSMFTGKTNLVTMALEALLKQIRDPLNLFVIPTVMEANGVPENLWPHFVNGPIQAPPMTDIADFLARLTSGSPPVITAGPELENFLRGMYNIPLEEPGAREKMQEARNAEASKAQAESRMEEVDDPTTEPGADPDPDPDPDAGTEPAASGNQMAQDVDASDMSDAQLFAYHMTTAVIPMNEARIKFLGLPREPRFGNMTSPEFLRTLAEPEGPPGMRPTEPSQQSGHEDDEDDDE